jgi:nucleotide-binding universal stress UspA family protein
MAYRTILICLNEIERTPQLIAAARRLGVKFKAHIAGLYVIPGVQVYPSDGLGMSAGVFDGTRNYFLNQLPKIRTDFEAAMKADNLTFDLRVVDSSQPNIATDVIENSRNVELIVLSSTNREKGNGVESGFVEQVLLAAGRPVLILPYKGNAEIKFEDVMLGWNDSRESARAAFDALPFLKHAKRTKIVTVDVSPGDPIAGANIAETLDRDGVKCEVVNVASGGRNPGETLLLAAREYGVGLLVLGAYGHMRLTEWIFGGATQYVLQNLDRPILMSH